MVLMTAQGFPPGTSLDDTEMALGMQTKAVTSQSTILAGPGLTLEAAIWPINSL